jgi:UDP-glucose 4-epimerase
MDTRRDFVFVDDLVDVVVKAIDGVGRRGVYHISSGSDYGIKELHDEVVRAMGLPDIPVEVRARNPDDAFTILLDPTDTQRDFQWRVKTTLADGVARAVQYYRTYGVAETFTHLTATDR